jgi:uncharacterized protein (DUF305 family)
MRNGMIAGIAGAVVVAALVLSPLASAFAQQVGPMPMSGVGPHPSGMAMHGVGMHGGMMMGSGPGMSGPAAGQRVDIGQHFIQEMIPHHEDAITMADLALAQVEHPELGELAANIKRVQAEEIDQMQAWYREWYGAEVPDGMMGRGMGPMAGHDPAAIGTARPFDKAFIEEMIPHHQMAVMMATHMLPGVQQPELRSLLESIAASQSAEIEQMRRWYREWYGAEPPAAIPGRHAGPTMPDGAPRGPRHGGPPTGG